MNFEQFEDHIIEYLEDEFGYKSKISVKDIVKNNGRILRGVTVFFEGVKACPTVYLNSMYEDYKRGESFEYICENIKETLINARFNMLMDVDDLYCYEKIKDKILVRLINTDKNENLLKDVPHVNFLDLTAVFYIIIKADNGEAGSILLHDSMVKPWNIKTEDLFEIAKENTKNYLKGEIINIEDLLINMLRQRGEGEMDEMLEEIRQSKRTNDYFPMYVLSGKDKMYGAACMLDETLLKNFSEMVDSDYYILPSSIHELILVPDSEMEDGDRLKDIVKEVNNSNVDESDFLSNNIYVYSKILGKVVRYGTLN